MRVFRLIFCISLLFTFAFAQDAASNSSSSNDSGLPKLQQFDLKLVDKTADPCVDFYKYSCSKWMAANPIPADQS